jgi:hypothetical protein
MGENDELHAAMSGTQVLNNSCKDRETALASYAEGIVFYSQATTWL